MRRDEEARDWTGLIDLAMADVEGFESMMLGVYVVRTVNSGQADWTEPAARSMVRIWVT